MEKRVILLVPSDLLIMTQSNVSASFVGGRSGRALRLRLSVEAKLMMWWGSWVDHRSTGLVFALGGVITR